MLTVATKFECIRFLLLSCVQLVLAATMSTASKNENFPKIDIIHS